MSDFNQPSLRRKFVVVLMSRLSWSHNETSRSVSKLMSTPSVKIILKSLYRNNVQFGLNRAHVLIVDRYFV